MSLEKEEPVLFSDEPHIPKLLLIKEPTTQEERDFLPKTNMLIWGTPLYFSSKPLSQYQEHEKEFFLSMSELLTQAYARDIIDLIPVVPEPSYYFIHLQDTIAYRHLVEEYIEEGKRHHAKTFIGRY